MAKEKVLWSCQECGHQQVKWTGSCPTCQKWNTLVQEMQRVEKNARFELRDRPKSEPKRVKEIDPEGFRRIPTKLPELDRLFGGGIVEGSLILLAGDPGIGKSTLILQVSQSLAAQGLTVLYVCGEESVEQTSIRARRLGATADQLFLYSETLFSQIKWQVEQLRPDVLIIDSIQIMYKSELPSSPGSVVQVREIATELMHLAKGLNIATFLIGHVTKSGEIAGPRVLEHLVDVVLEFEGDRQHGYRMLRGIKNRFGPTDEIVIFQMGGNGLSEVDNPSLLFLEERKKGASGSVIVPTLEGSRAILVEVQALVATSAFPTSTRRCSGLDQNRLALLLAVLEKRVGYQLHHCDVFVSIAGGMKIQEPAIDLSVLMAIASSFSNRALDPQTTIVGEVGLGGEVRTVPRIESRIKEAIHMGFARCLIPKRNLKGLPKELSAAIELVGIELVEEAIDAVIK